MNTSNQTEVGTVHAAHDQHSYDDPMAGAQSFKMIPGNITIIYSFIMQPFFIVLLVRQFYGISQLHQFTKRIKETSMRKILALENEAEYGG